jgi:hypothetical protein
MRRPKLTEQFAEVPRNAQPVVAFAHGKHRAVILTIVLGEVHCTSDWFHPRNGQPGQYEAGGRRVFNCASGADGVKAKVAELLVKRRSSSNLRKDGYISIQARLG